MIDSRGGKARIQSAQEAPMKKQTAGRDWYQEEGKAPPN